MIFADKLINLRKKSGWSQEELAEQMGVSRQSVSKWEGAQTIPDLEKILQLAELFGVSIDYLLREEQETTEAEMCADTTAASMRRVSMEEANAFLEVKEVTARSIAAGVLLCILSPTCLMLLAAMSEDPSFAISENIAAGMGLIVMLLMITAAVASFIVSGSKTAPYAYLEKEIFETAYGVSGMVQERKRQFSSTYIRGNTAGVCLCILSLLPIFASILLDTENEVLLMAMVVGMFLLISVGVWLFIRVGIVWASFQKLLQEGEYSREQKSPVVQTVSAVYWPVVIVVYLGYSFLSRQWDISWIIWPLAGVLYPAVLNLARLLHEKRK